MHVAPLGHAPLWPRLLYDVMVRVRAVIGVVFIQFVERELLARRE